MALVFCQTCNTYYPGDPFTHVCFGSVPAPKLTAEQVWERIEPTLRTRVDSAWFDAVTQNLWKVNGNVWAIMCHAVAEVFGNAGHVHTGLCVPLSEHQAAVTRADNAEKTLAEKQTFTRDEFVAAHRKITEWLEHALGELKQIRDKPIANTLSFLTSLNAYMQRDKLPAELQRQFLDVTRMLMRAVNADKADR